MKEIIEIKGNRDEFMKVVKDTFKKWGIRGRIPYADRFDKEGLL